MRRSTIIGAVLAGGLALAGCSPSYEDSDVPPAPGTPPPNAGPAANEPGEPTDQESDFEFTQQLTASQQWTVELAQVAEQQGEDPALTGLATQIQQQARSTLDEVPGEASEAPEDPATEATESLPDQTDIDQLAELSGAEFEQRWTSMMTNLQQFTLQLADNQVDQSKESGEDQLLPLAERISSETQSTLSELNSLD